VAVLDINDSLNSAAARLIEIALEILLYFDMKKQKHQ